MNCPPSSSSRRGSALLIVIGMLSFMVVSAVSFAIFMRQGRVPSSYLRRSTTARYLLKAALANAISRIDGRFASAGQIDNGIATSRCEGIYDDPYPGVGPSKNYVSGNSKKFNDPSNATGIRGDGDYWLHRIFCPFGEVSPDETVSTLTLEGLAYLPPAIINEARLYSRHTRTAKWRNLAYDAGRYAFCAIDVSDCFDINKLLANERRTSAGNSRVNLSSLFPNNGAALDELLTAWESSKIPFVSVADYNIMAENSPFAPFYKYIGTSGEAIYNNGDYQSVSNALFITDTWFPPTNVTATVKRFDLESGTKNQPFKTFTDSANFLTPAKSPTDLCKVLQKNIGGVGLACLYDYLDKNSRPISFVIPTVETVPMVCGIGLAHNNKFVPKVTQGAAVTSQEIAKGGNANVKYKYVSKKYSLVALMNSMVLSGVTAFPFKRTSAKKDVSGTYTGEALVRVFFGPKTILSRLDAGSPLYPSQQSDWNTGWQRGVLTVKCPISGISFASDVKKTTDAAKQFTAQVSPPAVTAPLFHYVEEVKVEKDPTTGNTSETPTGVKYYSLDGIKGSNDALVPRDKDGKEVAWWTAATANNVEPTNGGTQPQSAGTALGSEEYVPHVLVWVRIKDGSDTVDIVPARVEDDGTWGASAFNAQGQAAKFGDGTPVLEFRGDATRAFKYDTTVETKLDGTPETFPEWSQLYVVDPRYNHAPENWFAMKGNGDAKPEEWLKAIGADEKGGLIGSDGRDGDIFMFTSDQEVMQSIGELAFLPYVQEMDGSGDFFENDYLDNSNFSGSDFTKRSYAQGSKLSASDMKKFACGNFMWRTYSAFPTESNGGYDPIYALRDGSVPVEVVAGEGKFRANPYSPDERVMMAVVKDTPFDYTVASANEDRNETATMEPSQRAKFAFCKNNAIAKLDDDEQADIAAEMCDKFASWAKRSGMDRFDWAAAMRDMQWYDNRCNDEQKSLFGLDDFNETLHGVDRKFLFSFWRECFQNRQQLFLVFIRAEPLTVGGMGEGSLASSQLGARGVALVWRDPQPPSVQNRPSRDALGSAATSDSTVPHRTRVLFYHQFD